MQTLNGKIWLALEGGVRSLVMGADAWPIAWPSVEFVTPDDQPFIAVGEVKTPPQRATMSGMVREYAGTLTVSAVIPLPSSRYAPNSQFAGIIADHFTGNLRYADVCLTLESTSGAGPYASGGYRDGSWWREPVVIPWRTYA